jgi:hypothetical protein
MLSLGSWRRTTFGKPRLAVALAVLGGGLTGCSEQVQGPVHAPGTSGAVVQVDVSSASVPIPADLFGIGVEVREVPLYAHGGRTVQRAVALMRPRMEASLPLRVGGYSSDLAYWNATPNKSVPGAFRVGPVWMGQLAQLSHRLRAKVTLTTNLAVHSPTMAAAFARAASRALSPSHLAGAVFGDEPDLYGREPWLASERVSSTTGASGQWTADFTPADYRSLFRVYGRAVRRAVPGVQLSGPELANTGPAWLQSLGGLGSLQPSAITVHRYPTRCRPPGSPDYPTESLLLSAGASTGLANGLSSAVTIAHQQGLPLVVSEMNSASCSGPPGVTDSFATALWAPDALFEMIRAGVHAIDWHLRPYFLNAPFELKKGGIVVRPELYGLTLFARMLQPHARLAQTRVTTAPDADVKAWSVRSRSGTALLLINKGPARTSVAVRGTGLRGTGRLEQLRAPSVSSTSGVTLGGQTIGPDARWRGRLHVMAVTGEAGTYSVSVPGYSAVEINWPRG